MAVLPFASRTDLEQELGDNQRALDRALNAVPVSVEADARRWETVAVLRWWERALGEQLAERNS